MAREMVELPGQDRQIDARSIVTLIVFFAVNALVLFPVRIPLPLFLPKIWTRLLYGSSATTSQPGRNVGKNAAARAGEEKLEPARSTQSDHAADEPAASGDESDSTATASGAGNDTHAGQEAAGGKESTGLQAESPHQILREKMVAHPEVRRWYFTLGLETSPVIGVLLLLASTCIPGSVIRDGIVGTQGVRPYDIMTLFISFAYISLSLDCTGLLRYLAFYVGSRTSTSATRLYTSFFLFWVVAGLIVGNDPLILSGTPFLVYFTSHAKIQPPTAYLFTQFQSANLVSALLVSSNPTNLVLTQAFGISFLSYSAWLALPTIAGVVVLYPLLRFYLFRGTGLIPKEINAPKVDPKAALVDPWGGIFGATLFITTIALLVGLSAAGKLEGVEGVWTVTAPAALIMLARDCIRDIYVRGKKGDSNSVIEGDRKREMVKDRPEHRDAVGPVARGDDEKAAAAQEEAKSAATTAERPISRASTPTINGLAEGAASEEHASSSMDKLEPVKGSATPPAVSAAAAPKGSVPPSRAPSPPPVVAALRDHDAAGSADKAPINPVLRPLRPLVRMFPTPCLIATRLPLPLIPFAFSMFILVEALQYTGWITVWAGWWASWAAVGGVAGGVWLMGMIGALGCNVFGTNIGATVLLSRVLQQWELSTPNVSQRTLYGSVFALAVGSNFGAYSFVFPASLAGLLWRDILGQKGLTVGRREFVRWNTVPVFVTMIAACLVVAGEVCVMYKD